MRGSSILIIGLAGVVGLVWSYQRLPDAFKTINDALADSTCSNSTIQSGIETTIKSYNPSKLLWGNLFQKINKIEVTGIRTISPGFCKAALTIYSNNVTIPVNIDSFEYSVTWTDDRSQIFLEIKPEMMFSIAWKLSLTPK